MSILADSIKHLVSIKIKRREDGITDQYNRILMTKMCVLFSAIIGFNYFSDKVSCIVGNSESMDGDFVGATCWIQGFYIYTDLRDRLEDSAYFGIPRNMDYDGTDAQGVLCSTTDRARDNIESCTPMKKQFYLQYQYMPFLLASFAMLFYAPYLVFKFVNTDLVSLKDAIKTGTANAEGLVASYFNQKVNSAKRMRYRVIMMILIRVLYLLANLGALLGLDNLLLGHYLPYGKNYVTTSISAANELHDSNLKTREDAKPGNTLLPSMGYCDVQEASRDVRNTRINYHKLLCEISPHVLYQYVLLVFWFLLFMGIVLSVAGIIASVSGHLVNYFVFATRHTPDASRSLYKALTIREIDYLEYIRRKNLPLYSEVLEKLRAARLVDGEKPMKTDTDKGFFFS